MRKAGFFSLLVVFLLTLTSFAYGSEEKSKGTRPDFVYMDIEGDIYLLTRDEKGEYISERLEIQKSKTHEELISILKENSDPVERIKAAWALGETRDMAVVEPLIDALGLDPVPGVKMIIANALRKITGKDFVDDHARWYRWWRESEGEVDSIELQQEEKFKNRFTIMTKSFNENCMSTAVYEISTDSMVIRDGVFPFKDGKALIFCYGAKHILRGRVSHDGYIFDSNSEDPLLFKVIQNMGYVHAGGKGTVTMPDGKVVKLYDWEDSVRHLVFALTDSDWVVRKKAAKALGELKNPQTAEPLILALKDENRDVRKKAAEALGKLRNPVAVEPLILALRDSDEQVRKAAARSLAEIAQSGNIEE